MGMNVNSRIIALTKQLKGISQNQKLEIKVPEKSSENVETPVDTLKNDNGVRTFNGWKG